MLVVACLSMIMLVASPALRATPGGVGSSEQEYDCGGSCHDNPSTATISIWAPTQRLSLGGSVEVTVNVTGGQAVDILGVMIVSDKSTVPASIPTVSGWVINSDPSGVTKFNYFETTTYSGGVSWTWSLSAPTTAGSYSLFARTMHGGGSAYATNTVSGVSFLVGNISTTGPTVIITAPAPGSTVKGVVTIEADVLSTVDLRYVRLTLNGLEIGNKTAAPYVFSVESTVFKDGTYTLNVTAVDVNGHAGSGSITLKFSNAAENSILIMWVWTMAAGTIAIIAWIGVLIVAVLLIRKKRIEGRLN